MNRAAGDCTTVDPSRLAPDTLCMGAASTNSPGNPPWALAAGPVGLAAALASLYSLGPAGIAAAAVVLFACVFAAVHHAELVAHRVGEPLGTLVLAVAVTIIEVAVILSLMLGGSEAAQTLARDTVFAAVMIIINGIIGISLLLGAARYHEQQVGSLGARSALATLTALAVLTLVLPNFTTSVAGPVYSSGQLAFVAMCALVLYGTFLLVQTVRHRDYFLPPAHAGEEDHAAPPTAAAARMSFLMLCVALLAVVLLAKGLSEPLEVAIKQARLPLSVVGVALAAMVLLPEGLAALRAARRNRLQTSINLALGSALATIGLTIPAVAVAALLLDLPLAMGLDPKSIVLLALSIYVAALSLAGGRTTVLQGVVHLVILGVYLLVTIIP